MPMTHGFTITVKRIGQNDDGDRIVKAQFRVKNCAQSTYVRSQEQENTNQNSDEQNITLHVPIKTDIRVQDQVVMPDGTEWMVWGVPAVLQSPFTG